MLPAKPDSCRAGTNIAETDSCEAAAVSNGGTEAVVAKSTKPSSLAPEGRSNTPHHKTIFAGFSGFRFQAETDESKMPVSAGFTFWFRFQSGFPGVETVETI